MKKAMTPFIQDIAQHLGMMDNIPMMMRRMKVVQGDTGQHMKPQTDIDPYMNGDKGQ